MSESFREKKEILFSRIFRGPPKNAKNFVRKKKRKFFFSFPCPFGESEAFSSQFFNVSDRDIIQQQVLCLATEATRDIFFFCRTYNPLSRKFGFPINPSRLCAQKSQVGTGKSKECLVLRMSVGGPSRWRILSYFLLFSCSSLCETEFMHRLDAAKGQEANYFLKIDV